MAVLAGHHIQQQLPLGIQHAQRLPRQHRRAQASRFSDPMVRSGQMIAVQNPHVEAGERTSAGAAEIVDETFVVQSTGHQPMETRSAMAYWQNGKLFLNGSTQSVIRTVEPIARWVGIEPEDIVLVSEYCGGGFGSKGAGAISMAIPALLSKKAGQPVMMRISREEEHAIGRARTGMVGRARVGFRKDGRITALDLFIVEDNGPYGPMGDHRSAANAASLIWQPMAMRFRGVPVLTNTPPRSQQRSPGPMQANGIMEPLVSKAARKLGMDQVAIRRTNAPEGKAPYGPPAAGGRRRYTTSAFVKEALDRGAQAFDWTTRASRAGVRRGSKVRGVGVAVGPHGAGSIGYDGLMTIRPDGMLHVQSGVGNLGTHSMVDLARDAMEATHGANEESMDPRTAHRRRPRDRGRDDVRADTHGVQLGGAVPTGRQGPRCRAERLPSSRMDTERRDAG